MANTSTRSAPTRRMTVVAQDPSIRTADGRILMSTIEVPSEELMAGPVGYRVQVVDFDAHSRTYHGAHQLPARYEDEPASWRRGSDAILSDYRFHAQNAYALIMKTLARFEYALGRRIGWSFRVHQLKVAPHGLMDLNAFYSRQAEGLVLGFFPDARGKNIYTCLSHDVVVHETTHALVDALRERYLDPSNPDQAAFHEGFSDVVALLSVFSQRELVEELLRGKPSPGVPAGYLRERDVSAEALRDTALFKLAEQMGPELQTARGDALRHSVELEPGHDWMSDPEMLEPHLRGEILAAAVLNGFVEAWTQRLHDAKAPDQKYHALRRVAEEGADIAETLLTMWIRALDYMPPVHLEFGDALTAALTADAEVRPDDSRFRLRAHMLRSFKGYGIVPAARHTAEGVWPRAPQNLNYDCVRFESMRSDRDEVFRFIWENRGALDVREGAHTEVLTVRPCTRIGSDGFTVRETVAQYYQVARLTPVELKAKGIDLPAEYVAELERAQRARTGKRGATQDDGMGLDEDPADDEGITTPIYGGGVLIFDEYGRLKYHIRNDLFEAEQSSRLAHLWISGQLNAGRNGARLSSARLSALHRQRAIGARKFPERGW